MSTAPPADDRPYPWKRQSLLEDENQNPHDTEPSGARRERKWSRSRSSAPDDTKSGEVTEDESEAPSCDRRSSKSLTFIIAVFGTRQLALAAGKDRETYIRIVIRELVIYLFYLAVLCSICFGTMSSSTYYFTRVISDIFVDQPFETESGRTLRDSQQIDDFWKFAEKTLVEGIYWEFLYNDGVVKPGQSGSPILVTQNGILFENRLIGTPRLRQIRIRPDSCEIAPNFRRLIRQCYAPYDEALEDKTSPWRQLPGSAWRYHSADKLGGIPYWGRLATYSAAGSYVDLHIDDVTNLPIIDPAAASALEKTKEQIKFLKRNHWITRATRAIFFDFVVYNANINLFAVVKLAWEIPATGGVITSWSIRTVNLIRYLNWFDLYVIFPCEVVFCIFTIYYLIQEILEMTHLGCRDYFSDIWSFVDIFILCISGVCFGLSVFRHVMVTDKLDGLIANGQEFINFEKLAFWQLQYINCLAVLIFIAWIKTFKYISFNKTMTQLSVTLSRCAADVGGFAIMFFIVFAAFAQLGYLMFGSEIQDFSTFLDSVFTLLRLILGDFNFRQLEAANRFLGPIYFVAYVFFVFFVLLNMFLAIINETFSEVKAEMQARRNEFEIADYFKRGLNNIKAWFGRKDPKLDAKYAVKLAPREGQITYEELRKNLEDAQFSDVEIEMFLARYELDRNRALDEDEIQHVLAELEGNTFASGGSKGDGSSRLGAGFTEPINYEVYQAEIDALENRIFAIENSLAVVTSKIDLMVQKLDKKFKL